MNSINLHMHTKYSLDGNLDINEIVNICLTNGISYLSITDHNNCDAYFELDLKKINSSGVLIYGMEADAIINNVTYDILCYGFELNKVSEWASRKYGNIESRQIKIYNKLVEMCQKLNLKLDDTCSFDPKKEFAHAAIYRMLYANPESRMFLEKYKVLNSGILYRLSTMDTKFPLHIDMNIVWPTIDELATIIHDNGGKLFLAHPYKYSSEINIKEMLDSCSLFIDGIEISNESKSDEVEYLYNYAKCNNLLVCAGSDFHGTEKHNNLNIDYLDEKMKKDIINWIDVVLGKINF